ncbi:MAG: shikimate dehydrogenase [Anaerolineae bacterium]|nr:shikimate dehydrogenase [Anaerolineae bacterium]
MATTCDIRGSTRLLGVIGDPVAHSRSPAMHNAAFRALGLDWCYLPLHVTPTNLEAALRGLIALEFVGANVTIPHKEHAAALCNELTPAAEAVAAVNTLTVQGESLAGDNTDVGGLLLTLAEAGVDVEGRESVVLGAGGSARAVVYALAQSGARVAVANRTLERAEALVERLQSRVRGQVQALSLADTAALQASLERATLLVNTTPVGMSPGPDESPLPAGLRFHPGLTVLDLVYAPRQTRLLRDAAAQGCRVIEGLRVLVYQGALSFECWTGRAAPVEVMTRAAED